MSDVVIEKSKDRLEIIKEIEKLEREGKFDIDPEKDPPNIKLEVENVDYLNKKLSSKINNKIAKFVGRKFMKKLLEDKKLIIKEINGIENLDNIKGGAVLTCNHFNPFDSFAMEYLYEVSKKSKTSELYRVIKEGNYTNFPGLYGFLFKNCNTLPLSSSVNTMQAFIEAVSSVLKNGDLVLIYPEQSLWWNYKKPKPLKTGGFKIAVKCNVPVVPVFITMTESDIIGDDGFNILEYHINVGKPIYQDESLTVKQNIENMKNKNYEVWKNIYEDFYKIPLEYTTLKKMKSYENKR